MNLEGFIFYFLFVLFVLMLFLFLMFLFDIPENENEKVIKIKCSNIKCAYDATLIHKGMNICLCDDCAEKFNHKRNFVNI